MLTLPLHKRVIGSFLSKYKRRGKNRQIGAELSQAQRAKLREPTTKPD